MTQAEREQENGKEKEKEREKEKEKEQRGVKRPIVPAAIAEPLQEVNRHNLYFHSDYPLIFTTSVIFNMKYLYTKCIDDAFDSLMTIVVAG